MNLAGRPCEKRVRPKFRGDVPRDEPVVTPEGVAMCGEQFGGAAQRFDPTRCPLLQGLSTEDADRMMREDPRLRACIGAVESGKPDLEPCVAKMVRAHEARGRARSPKVA